MRVGFVLVLPPVIVAEPSAMRNPLALAVIVYVPAGAVRLKLPSGSAVMEVTSVSAAYRLTVTGLLARTCPVRLPSVGAVGVGEPTGADPVAVGAGEPAGVGVEVSTGVDCVAVGVAVPAS